MTQRSFLNNVSISGVPGTSSMAYIYAADENKIIGCDLIQLHVFVGPDVREQAYMNCRFQACLIYLYPGGVGRRAFASCYFEDDCKFIDGPSQSDTYQPEEKT